MYDAPPPNKIKNIPPMPWWFPYTELFMLGSYVLVLTVLVIVLSVYYMNKTPKNPSGVTVKHGSSALLGKKPLNRRELC